MSAGDRDTLAELLAKHLYDGASTCACGTNIMQRPVGTSRNDSHRAHVADVLLASDWLLEQRAEAWDEGHGVGFTDCSRYLAAVEFNKYPRPEDTPNPYRTTEDTGG